MKQLRYHYGDPLAGKVILLNAPMNTGKDVAAEVLCNALGTDKREFKAALFNIALAITGISREAFFTIYNNRDTKESPRPEFFGMSARELLIWISEDVCKPKFGKQYFGNPAANSIDPDVGAVFSDSGFPEEVYPMAERFGANNIYIVRFTRGGASFKSNDSRMFLQESDLPEGINFLDTTNDKTLNEFCNTVSNWVVKS